MYGETAPANESTFLHGLGKIVVLPFSFTELARIVFPREKGAKKSLLCFVGAVPSWPEGNVFVRTNKGCLKVTERLGSITNSLVFPQVKWEPLYQSQFSVVL